MPAQSTGTLQAPCNWNVPAMGTTMDMVICPQSLSGPTDPGVSQCCKKGDFCLGNWLCLEAPQRITNSSSGLYAVGCTSIDGTNKGCNNHCASQPDASLNYNVDQGSYSCCGVSDGTSDCHTSTNETWPGTTPQLILAMAKFAQPNMSGAPNFNVLKDSQLMPAVQAGFTPVGNGSSSSESATSSTASATNPTITSSPQVAGVAAPAANSKGPFDSHPWLLGLVVSLSIVAVLVIGGSLVFCHLRRRRTATARAQTEKLEQSQEPDWVTRFYGLHEMNGQSHVDAHRVEVHGSDIPELGCKDSLGKAKLTSRRLYTELDGREINCPESISSVSSVSRKQIRSARPHHTGESRDMSRQSLLRSLISSPLQSSPSLEQNSSPFSDYQVSDPRIESSPKDQRPSWPGSRSISSSRPSSSQQKPSSAIRPASRSSSYGAHGHACSTPHSSSTINYPSRARASSLVRSYSSIYLQSSPTSRPIQAYFPNDTTVGGSSSPVRPLSHTHCWVRSEASASSPQTQSSTGYLSGSSHGSGDNLI